MSDLVKNPSALKKLFKQTTFAKDDPPTWAKLSVAEEDGEKHFYVPQCSMLGETMISLADTYEQSGADCVFISELIRLYKTGKLVYKTNDAFFKGK